MRDRKAGTGESERAASPETRGDESGSTPEAVELDQVLQAQKLESLGVLAGSIAHDFNNILTGVLGNAELALASLEPATPGRDYLIDIEIAARRAADLSRELLAYAGKGKFVVEPLDLSELIEDAKQLVAVSLVKKPRISYELGADLGAIDADATQVRQILLNLITNAAEAIRDPNGSISIRTGGREFDAEYLEGTYSSGTLSPGYYTYLEVSDSGIGMDESTESRIFQPFFTTKMTGRGLGLATVLRILESHRGALQVTSELGRGTTIRALFPATDKPVVAASLDPVDASWRGSGTVLIVDDDEAVRLVAARMVEALGFDVLTAAGGTEALAMLEKISDTVDLALVDLTMPGPSGVEVIREMTRIRGDLNTALMSGYSRQEMEERFADAGIKCFVQKPLALDGMRELLKGTLEASVESVKQSTADSLLESDWVRLQDQLVAHRKLSSAIELTQYDTALRLARAAETKSNKLSGRLSRISRLAAELSRELEVSGEGIEVLAAAAPFHDIGEIGVSDAVLRKPGPLSEDEWGIVKRHPVIGAELLSGLSSRVISAAAEIALSHHERWDGSGYPYGLAGDAIPLFGQIVGFVDQYDAIRSPRPYKPAFGHDRACDILLHGDERSKPGHFDPQVLAAFDASKDRFAEVFATHKSDAPYTAPGGWRSLED